MKKITKDQMAKRLNGREYGKELTKLDRADAKKNKLAIIYGYSDDLMELDGVLSDEVGASDEGNVIFIDKKGTYSLAKFIKSQKIVADFTEHGWRYKTKIPHAIFEIMEDGKLWCRGIVFSLNDVK